MPPTIRCPSKKDLSDYLVGKLGNEDSHSLEQHVRDCSDCQSHIDRIENRNDPLLASIRRPAPDDPILFEPECEQAIDRGRSMKRHVASRGDDAVHEPISSEADLGHLRDYQLIAKIGQGGMGSVYKALHTRLNRVVAVKVLPTDPTRNVDAVARFDREMKAIGNLDHPNVVRASDAGESDGHHYLVMELIDGQDLSTLAKCVETLSVADACELVRQAAIGLEYAHDNGLIHRDVKPSNLMLSADGQVKLLDVGLALLNQPIVGDNELTSTGQVMGTLDYMAPEQLGDAHTVDHQADIYSLGATLYRLLSGQAPHSGRQYDTAAKKLLAIATEPIQVISEHRQDIPSKLSRVLEKMLAKNPDDRFTSAADVAAEMEAFNKGHDLTALLSRADQKDIVKGESASTFDHLSSAMTDTRRTHEEPQPQINVVAVSKRRSELPWFKVALALLGLLVVALAVYQISFRNGTLVVSVTGPEVEVVLKEHGVVVLDLKSDRKYTVWVAGPTTLPPGEYRLQIADDAGLRVEAKSFELTRGERKVVTVTFESDETNGKDPPAIVNDNSQSVQPSEPPRTPQTQEPIYVERLPTIQANTSDNDLALVPTQTLPNGDHWTIVTRGHAGRIHDVAFSPDGSRFASGGADGVLRIWSSEKAELLIAVPLSHKIQAIDWSPREDVVAVSDGSNIRIIDAGTGKTTELFEDHAKDVLDLRYSPDGSRLASCGFDQYLFLWDVADRSVEHHPLRACYQLQWLSATKLIATRPFENATTLFDLDTGDSRNISEAGPNQMQAISPDGTKLAVIREPYDTASILDTNDGIETAELRIDTYWHARAAFWNPRDNSSLFLVVEHDGGVFRLENWDIKSMKRTPVQSLPVRADNGYMSSNGQWIAVTHSDGTISLLKEENIPRTILGVAAETINATIFWRDQDNLLCLPGIEPSREEPRCTFTLNSRTGKPSIRQRFVTPATPGPGNTLITSTTSAGPLSGKLSVWNPITGRTRNSFNIPSHRALAISPDGKRLVGFDSPQIHLYDLQSEELHKTIAGFAHIYVIRWSPDGKWVAFGGNKEIFVWDTVEPPRQYALGSGVVDSISWGNDPRTLDIAVRDGEIMKLDLENNTLLRTDVLPGSSFHSCFTNDSRHVASLDRELTRITVYDRTLKRRTSVIQLLRGLETAIIRPDGKYRPSRLADNHLIYAVESKSKFTAISPDDFRDQYGVSNAITEISLFTEPEAARAELPATAIDRPADEESVPTTPTLEISPSAGQLIEAGAPLSRYATVTHPAKIDGIESWTIETLGHRGNVSWVEYSPDGRFVATAGRDDGVIRIYDGDAQAIYRLIVPPEIGPVGWSDIPGELISGGDQGTIFIWNVETGRLLRHIPGDGRRVVQMRCSQASGQLVLATHGNNEDGSASTFIERLNLVDSSRSLLAQVSGLKPSAIDITRNGKQALAVIRDNESDELGSLHVWNVESGDELNPIPNVITARWSPDCSQIAVSQRPGIVVLDATNLELESKRKIWSKRLEHHAVALAWSQAGDRLALVLDEEGQRSYGATVVVLQGLSDRTAKEVVAHRELTWTSALSWSGDGSSIACAGNDQLVIVDASRETILNRHQPAARRGRHRWSESGPVRKDGLIARFGQLSGQRFTWSPNGRYRAKSQEGAGVFEPTKGQVNGIVVPSNSILAFSRDSTHLAIAEDIRITVWEIEKPDRPMVNFSLQPSKGSIKTIVFGSDLTLYISYDDGIFVYDLATRKGAPTAKWHIDTPNAMAVSQDGEILATGGGPVSLWDTRTGQELEHLEWFTQGGSRQIHWSPEGQLSVICSDDTVRSFDLATNAKRVLLQKSRSGDLDQIRGGLFFADGTMVARRTVDHSLRLTELSTNTTMTIINLLSDNWLELSPNGHYRCTPFVERQLRYVVRKQGGQQLTFTCEAFRSRFGWENDPRRVWQPRQHLE